MFLSILTTLLLLSPSASAKETFDWNFLDAKIPGRIEVSGFSDAKPTAQGFHINTTTEGRFIRTTDFPYPVDGITLVLGPSNQTEAILLWHAEGMPPTDVVQLPFLIEGSDTGQQIDIPLTNYPQWDRRADRLGLALPPGANVTIRSIEFTHWNVFEKTWTGVRSFWTLDLFRPYSINFVWGPVLNFNPVALERLFFRPPPIGWSANRIFYAVIVLAAIGCAVWWRKNRWQRSSAGKSALATFLAILCGLWIFYDFRMGLETINYYIYDYTHFVSLQRGAREFRERGVFYDFADEVKDIVAGRDRYIFLSAQRWPYLGAIRYLTYPSIPTDPEQQKTGVDTWVIYDRTDLTVSPEGMLLVDGQPAAGPGKVLLEYQPGIFVFRTNP